MPAFVPILLAPIALALLVVGLLFADSAVSGWRRIASRHGTSNPVPDATPQDGSVGDTAILQLRGRLRAAATDRGLYVAPPAPLRFTHRPLLIPWNQISVREEQRRLGVPILTLSIGRMHLGFIRLRGGVAGDVLERVGG